MRYLVIASHARYAEGLKNAIEFLTSETDIEAINAYIEGSEDIEEQAAEVAAKVGENDEMIILTDIMGGSVNQKFLPLMRENIHIISGVNIPLAISLVLCPKDTRLDRDTIERIIEESKEQIIYMNTYNSDCSEDDE